MFIRKIYRSDMLRCVLCSEAPCSKSCGKIDPAGILRSIWFDNEKVSAGTLPDENPCTNAHVR